MPVDKWYTGTCIDTLYMVLMQIIQFVYITCIKIIFLNKLEDYIKWTLPASTDKHQLTQQLLKFLYIHGAAKPPIIMPFLDDILCSKLNCWPHNKEKEFALKS